MSRKRRTNALPPKLVAPDSSKEMTFALVVISDGAYGSKGPEKRIEFFESQEMATTAGNVVLRDGRADVFVVEVKLASESLDDDSDD